MKVSVIIPAYNAHKTLSRCLASIMIQSIVEDLEVIVVDDCSTDGGYEKEISTFRPFMNIREITLEKNGGPGVARQAGIDESTAPFFTCIDADDTFSGAYALECLVKYLDNPGVNMVSSVFVEVHEEDKEKNIDMIQKKLRMLISGLAQAGLIARQANNDDLRIILDNFLNAGRTTTFGTVMPA